MAKVSFNQQIISILINQRPFQLKVVVLEVRHLVDHLRNFSQFEFEDFRVGSIGAQYGI